MGAGEVLLVSSGGETQSWLSDGGGVGLGALSLTGADPAESKVTLVGAKLRGSQE